jgi:hypothetical protein
MGDYGDVTPISETDILPFVGEVQKFKKVVYQLLHQNKSHES